MMINSFYTNTPYPKQVPSFGRKKIIINKEQFEALISSGKTVPQICDYFSISPNKYYKLKNEFNIPSHIKDSLENISKITKEQIQQAINAGMKYNEIINKFGISSSAYNGLLKKFNIITESKSAKNNISSITKEKLQALVDSGKKVKAICEELNIPVRTYSRLLDKFGILTKRKQSKAHIESITREQILALMEQGLSKLEILEKLKIKNDTFYILLKRLDIPYNYRSHGNEINIPKEKLEEAIRSNKTTQEIADSLGIAVNTFHRKAKNQKVKTTYSPAIDIIKNIDVNEFQKSLQSGLTIENICKKFKITKAIYTSIIRKYNLTTRQRIATENVSKVTREQILELRKQNKSPKEILKELNISHSTYYRILGKSS